MLLEKKPMAGMDMLTVLARQMHAAQQLVRDRAARNSNELIEEEMTFGERIADKVARFGGSWTFIITFLAVLIVYTGVNIVLRQQAPGTRIPTSCSTSSSRCSPRSRRRSS